MALGDFSFPDFNSFPSQTTFTDNAGIQPQPPSSGGLYPSPSSTGSPPALNSLPRSTSNKRKSDSISTSTPLPESYEEASRIAAEEDKRRRNTAASARFRVKKKQREQALEKSSKEMSDKVAALEGRIGQLETENKWLKNLITEKNTGGGGEELRVLWEKFTNETTTNGRKGAERKDGVGTKA